MSKLQPGQFDELLFGLGLSHKEASLLLNAKPFQIYNWVNGIDEIPEDLSKRVLEMEDLVEDYVFTFMSEIDTLIEVKGKKPEVIPVIRYLGNQVFRKYMPNEHATFTYFKIYNSAISRIRIDAARDDINIVAVNFDPESYVQFLGDNEDSHLQRTAWAESIIKN
ncbi:MAG: DUF4447 family protein [Sneathiella sp.]|nr:DUF4447 family protein [Sneathiella sp.]